MNSPLITIIVTVVAVLVIMRIVLNAMQHRIARPAGIFWTIVWLGIIVVFWSPDIASRLALIVGIGRGADLVLYSAIMVIVYLLYKLFIRCERLEHEITTLTRELALHHGAEQKGHSDPDPQL
jgi:small membrane protein